MVNPRTFWAYGLRVESSFDLPIISSAEPAKQPDVRLRLVEEGETIAPWYDAQGTLAWQSMFPDECHVRCERGRDGDYRLTYGRRASFLLEAGGETLLCDPAVGEELKWKRFLLETALCCVSLIRGFEALHASAVNTRHGVVAFVGPPGSGKSTLAAELVRRGHSLFADDVLALNRESGQVHVHAGPPVMTLAAESQALEAVGNPLEPATAEGMLWVQAHRAGGNPQPPAAIFILDLRHQPDAEIVEQSAGPGRLLPHTLSLNRDPARALSRFSLLRELAAGAPIYRLATGDGEPGELADIVEEKLRSPSSWMRHVPAA